MLARAGVGSSPKRSITGGAGLGGATGAAGPLLIEVFLSEAERSSFAFSWTTLRGCSLSDIRPTMSLLNSTYHVVVASLSTKSGRVRNRAIHCPSFRVVLCSNEVLDLTRIEPLVSQSRDLPDMAITHASAGTWPGASLASQYLVVVSVCPSVHSTISMRTCWLWYCPT